MNTQKFFLVVSFSLLLGACSTTARKGNGPGLQFKGTENFGLAFLTVSQVGAHKLTVTLTIKDEQGKIIKTISSPLNKSFNIARNIATQNNEQGIFKGSRIHLIQLRPGTYSLAAYRGELHKHGLNGRASYHFARQHTAFKFKVNPGLTSYLGNLKFDLRHYKYVKVTVQDKIFRDMEWIRRRYPGVSILTLDRQVPKPRKANHTTVAIRSAQRH